MLDPYITCNFSSVPCHLADRRACWAACALWLTSTTNIRSTPKRLLCALLRHACPIMSLGKILAVSCVLIAVLAAPAFGEAEVVPPSIPNWEKLVDDTTATLVATATPHADPVQQALMEAAQAASQACTCPPVLAAGRHHDLIPMMCAQRWLCSCCIKHPADTGRDHDKAWVITIHHTDVVLAGMLMTSALLGSIQQAVFSLGYQQMWRPKQGLLVLCDESIMYIM